ncbi:hypothetical protein QQS21_002991 [Conoideocrella luteorostrata]|uniref:Peptidase A1 domain-containing protein n=1 Tax=Conoideocrella luteorostrata TaxID=1105319 RepID=A0AAJ0CWK4_9HYPO|nr:hypothetical protein QQS21_002991 [Conoideocrella luteorostrata]
MPSVYDVALLLGAAATASAGTVSIDFQKRSPVHEHYQAVARSLSGRATPAGAIELLAANNITGGGYYADLSIGTPGQKLSFQLDTGSSDTWMNAADTSFCSDEDAQVKMGFCTAKFDPTKSSTYKSVSKRGFNITYLDTRRILGDYFNDTVSIDGKTVTNQQLGLALTSVRPTGIMGLGFSNNVAAKVKYPTIIDNMVSQGVIEHPSFSLYLNDVDARNGTILFGGIDKAKYTGKLATLPMTTTPQAQSTNITSYAVSLKSLSATSLSLPSVEDMSVAIFDSGSTVTLVPDAFATSLQTKFGVVSLEYGSTSTPPLIDCAYGGDKGKDTTIDFQFDGVTVKVPMKEMVVNVFPKEIQDQLPSQLQSWQGVCLFGLASTKTYGVKSNKFFLLGDTFLRSSYVVYDMLNKQIGLAQSQPNATKSDVVAIAKDAKTLPDATGTADKSPSSPAGHVTPSFVAATILMAVAVMFSSI